MSEIGEKVKEYGALLKSAPLDSLELKWIESLVQDIVPSLCNLCYAEVEEEAVIETTKSILKQIFRKPRFPTSFEFASLENLAKLDHAVTCDFKRTYGEEKEEKEERYVEDKFLNRKKEENSIREI